jgi:hypothetical protein
VLLPVIRKLFLKVLEQVDAVAMHAAYVSTSYGNILYMGKLAVQENIRWSVPWGFTGIIAPQRIALTPEKSQCPRYVR